MLNLQLSAFSTLINSFFWNYFNQNDMILAIRKNSLIHCCVSSLYGVLYLSNLISKESQGYILNYSLGYIISDVYIYTFKNELYDEKYITYLHHGLFLIGVLNYDKYPNLYSNLILTELSTIPLNLQYIYRKNKNLKIKFSLLFYILFLVFRIGNCNYILYNMLLTNEYNNYINFSMIIFSILNGYWFHLMTKKLMRFLKGK